MDKHVVATETVETSLDFFGAADERRDRLTKQSDRMLWGGLVLALMLHASFLLGFAGRAPKEIGADKGDADAIAVSLLTEEQFRAETSTPPVPQAAPGKPAKTVAPPQPPAPPPKEEQKSEQKPEQPPPPPDLKPTTQEATNPAPPPPPPAEAEKPTEVKEPVKPATTPPETDQLDPNNPELLKLDVEPKKSEPKKVEPNKAEPNKNEPNRNEPKKTEQAKPQKRNEQRMAKLDEAMPPTHSFRAPPVDGGGRQGAFARPPGITKSGWNDDFARDVIRALQMTMPQMRALGRVTVRILLDKNGNISSVTVIRPSPNSNLNQSVVFAARQTSYPFPPAGATVADRTFLVTYIYD